jgi:hypothetical protein
MLTTFFKGLRSTKPESIVELSDVLQDIREGKWKSQVEACHVNLQEKDKLPCFTPTGEFNYRSIAGMQRYNGIICLDIDHVENPAALREKCKSIPWVHSAFITPSGKGLKVIVKTAATQEDYKETEIRVAEAFQQLTGFSRDNRCKDISRIQFVSFDPELYFNEDSTIFID